MTAAATEREPHGRNLHIAIRTVGVASWLIVGIVMVRIAWGGWPGGLPYVLRVEPTLAVLFGAVVVVVAFGLALALALDGSARTFRASAVGAAMALAFGVFLIVDSHDSGGAVVVASVVLLVVGLLAASRTADGASGP